MIQLLSTEVICCTFFSLKFCRPFAIFSKGMRGSKGHQKISRTWKNQFLSLTV